MTTDNTAADEAVQDNAAADTTMRGNPAATGRTEENTAAMDPAAASSAASEHDGEPDPRIAKARREAASYRERLRDAEGERDRTRTMLDAARRGLLAYSPFLGRVETAARRDVVDLFADSAALDGMFDEDGQVDEKAVNAWLDGVFATHPYFRRQVREDALARKVSNLAEHPQGSANPKRGGLAGALAKR